MKKRIPSVLIGAPQSNSGKTSISIGLIAALRRRGLTVQPFKVGPDFLDPTLLSCAAGRQAFNLDGWMMTRSYVQELVAQACADADVAVIEGVMGLFDGRSADGLSGSSAEIAAWLGTEVLLVVDVHGLARTIAPLVRGFSGFAEGVRIAGVIANQVGSANHAALLKEALAAAGQPPLLGAVGKNALPPLSSRHLGLVSAEESRLGDPALEQFASVIEQSLDLEAILALPSLEITPGPAHARPLQPRWRVGLAWDEAFQFVYQDNLEALRQAGIDWIRFSPIHDTTLPEGLAGIYFPGGYPEEQAARLAANHSMRQAIGDFARDGGAIYAECGGLMYLGRTLRDRAGETFPMTGILPIDTAMQPRMQALGYVEVTTTRPGPWGGAGQVIRGHEFHYSAILANDLAAAGWQTGYSLRSTRTGTIANEGFTNADGRILASYAHLHWASQPGLATHFVNWIKGSKGLRV